MIRTAKRLEQFPEYIFSRLAKKKAEVEKVSGRKVLNLSVGSPDFPPAKEYITQLQKYLEEENAHLYPGYSAIPEYALAIQAWYKNRFNVNLAQDELYPLHGAKDGVSNIALALLDEGDEVLIPDPGYPGFSGPAMMLGAKAIYYPLKEENNFKITIATLEKLVTSKTKCMWVNFPSNPTGQIITKEELSDIVAFARKHTITIIFDNAYAEITFDGYIAPSILEINGAKDVAVEIGSFSKSHSFAGYRMGWIVGNKTVITALAKIKSQMDSGETLALQKLGAYALNNPNKDWQTAMIKSYQTRRDIIAEKLKKLGLSFTLPKGSLYLWAKIPDSEIDSETFAYRLLEEKQVLLTPGTAFGEQGKRYVRVSISANIATINEYL